MINIGIGLTWAFRKISRYVSNLILSFEARVAADGGNFEAEPCLAAQLNSLQGKGLLTDASLVITPNAINEGVLYDVIPNTTLGDLDVIRATSATRVDANGLVEIPRTNLFTNSEGNLATYGTVIGNASNATVSITGFSNSIQIGNNTLATSVYKRTFTPVVGVQYSMSIFVQMDDNSLPVLGSTILTGDFSLIINNTLATLNPVIQQVGSSNIYRVSATFIAATTSTVFGVNKYIGQSAKGFRFTGIQLEVGNVTTEYIPTVASIRTKFAGITQDGSSASDIPRLDYTGSTCPSILVEPQRTNLALYSEQFDNAYWTKTRCSITANATTSPDGTINADKLVENTDTNSHFVDRTFTTVASTIYTYSVYAKKSEREFIVLECLTTGKAIFVSLNDGSLGTRIGYLVSDINVETLTNGWFRISVKDTSPSTVLRYINTIAISSSSASYTGNGTSGLFIWGAQLEAGANATSYIPTTSATVTRNADVISKTSATDLIGQTEGTIYSEVNFTASNLSDRTIVNLSDNTTNNWIFIRTSATVSNGIRFRIANGAALQFDYNSSAISTGVHKLCLSYKLNNISVYIDGVKVNSSITATIPNTSKINIGCMHDNTLQFNDKIKSVSLFKTQLADAECIALTTL